MKNEKKSFTIIELLVVISIIGLISAIALVYVRGQIDKARDTRRISDIKQIQKGLEMYLDKKGRYPDPAGNNCEGSDCPPGGWEVGNIDTHNAFIHPLVDEGIFGIVPIESVTGLSDLYTYRYYRYMANPGVCGGKAFYILAVWLKNSQYSYGAGDEVELCYRDYNSFWQDEHWYTIMGAE